MLSPSDTAIVFLLALLLFGPEQLPKIARQVGEAMRQMQSTTHSFMNEMERAARTNEPTIPAPPPTHTRNAEEVPPEAHDATPAEPVP
jgi:TatA/E family protein of Tat protein translocase